LDKCRQDFVQQLLTLIGQNIDRLCTAITHTDWTKQTDFIQQLLTLIGQM